MRPSSGLLPASAAPRDSPPRRRCHHHPSRPRRLELRELARGINLLPARRLRPQPALPDARPGREARLRARRSPLRRRTGNLSNTAFCVEPQAFGTELAIRRRQLTRFQTQGVSDSRRGLSPETGTPNPRLRKPTLAVALSSCPPELTALITICHRPGSTDSPEDAG